MKKTCISKDWYAACPGLDRFYPRVKGPFCKIDLPNDYAVAQPRDPKYSGSNGCYGGGVGAYVKYLKLPEEKKHLILNVDGAYMCSEVFLNDNKIAFHPHGYTPYLVDLTKGAHPGVTNKIMIVTNAMQPSTRWYSGAGVYRDVFLWEGGAVRVEPWDLFVTTPTLDTVVADVNLSADADTFTQVRADIFDAAGAFVTGDTLSVFAKAEQKTHATITMNVPDAHLWDTEKPYLYTMKIRVLVTGKVTDESETTFGIRTISADAKNGFRLNGKTMKLRGGCIHHDHGVLGSAAYPAAEYRKVSRLKAAGFNALRIAHNPPSAALLDACDRLGVIVMDEAFDMWNCQKSQTDYHLWFADRWAEDIACMVLAARNHPCVCSYSIGNEIVERDGRSDGAEWAAKLAAEIRRYDTTRFVTSGVCGMWSRPSPLDPPDYIEEFHVNDYAKWEDNNWEKLTEGYMAPLDIVGYNYLYSRYAAAHELYPDRVIWGSETHAIKFYDSWHEVLANDHVIGDFTWTAYDNMGENGTGRAAWARDEVIKGISVVGWPWRNCYQGDLDLCGYRRPQSYFREAVWIGGTEPRIFTTHPEHYGEGFSGTGWHWYDVLDTWTFDDKYLGKPVRCEVYTDADEIEWILNGNSLGRTAPVKAIASMDIPYEKGTLVSVAYKDGKECGRSSLTTVGKAAGVKIEPEKVLFKADARDLCYIDLTVTDCDGRRVPDSKAELTALVSGGELMGIFSGDPKNTDDYGTSTCHAFEGRAVCIVRARKPGAVTVTVGGPGLTAATVMVTAE